MPRLKDYWDLTNAFNLPTSLFNKGLINMRQFCLAKLLKHLSPRFGLMVEFLNRSFLMSPVDYVHLRSLSSSNLFRQFKWSLSWSHLSMISSCESNTKNNEKDFQSLRTDDYILPLQRRKNLQEFHKCLSRKGLISPFSSLVFYFPFSLSSSFSLVSSSSFLRISRFISILSKSMPRLGWWWASYLLQKSKHSPKYLEAVFSTSS